jgi:hypothetical protein
VCATTPGNGINCDNARRWSYWNFVNRSQGWQKVANVWESPTQ